MQRHAPTLAILALFAAGLIACSSSDSDSAADGGLADASPPPATPSAPFPISSLPRDTTPDVADDTFAQLTRDNRVFAFSLFDALRGSTPEDENLFFSAHSISQALAMMFGGAANQTYEQMAAALQFTLGDAVHPAFNRLDLELASRADLPLEEDEDQAFVLEIVNQSWGQQGFDFTQDYLDLLAEQYGAGVNLVDFAGDFENVRLDINAWVEEQTQERIRDLLPEGSLDDAVRLILVNAIYFYGSWEQPFDDRVTNDAPFTRLDGSTVDVPLMYQDRAFASVLDADRDTVAVSIPYIGGDVSLIAMMPADAQADFLAWEEAFGTDEFDALVAALTPQRIALRFPRFEDGGSFELKESLQALGMIDAFDRCDADFSGITGHPPCIDFRSLYIDEVYHQTFVSVDEKGTEATAATAVVGATPTSLPPSVNFDRPFLYAIYDHPTGTILFLGRMVDP